MSEVLGGFFYTAITYIVIVLGFSAGVLMWRNALRWRGRKMVLRMMSGSTCVYVSLCYAVIELAELPDERLLASILFRPAWVVMLALAAAFSIADY